MIKGWVRFAKPVGTIKIKNSIPNSSQEKNHKVNPDKQEENNNKDTCRNNEVEVKKAEAQTKEPKSWFLEKKINKLYQVISSRYHYVEKAKCIRMYFVCFPVRKKGK